VLRGGGVRQHHLNLTPLGGTSLGRRVPRVCLEVDMPPKTSLDYVESKRGEDRDEESYVTATRSAKVKVIEDRLFGSVVGARNRLYSFIYIYIPKTPCPTRAPNTPSTPPHKSTPSALLYARLPAPRRAPPCPHATLSLAAAECLPIPAPSRASLSARLSVPRRRASLTRRLLLPPIL
jgi:hypothetical protein